MTTAFSLESWQANDDTFQLDSGYEAYGISYYYQEVSVDMKEAGVVYCPYAQEYSGWDGGNTVSFEMGPNSGGISEEETEVTYYLNGVILKTTTSGVCMECMLKA